ncbi:Polygalacturonase [Phytophthora megakarya]|uniref:endo-polygalacturonase n=1 Tax=Phytophthora megakarya TaxID=4795 RepID=A0A225W462_9STRA|nr:Polygalacturonase [Phytophthora megakarya]
MKFLSTAFAAFALLATSVNGSPMLRMEAEGKSKTGLEQVQQQQQSSGTSSSGCNLSGTYKKGTDISSCSSVTIGSLTVPAGVTLDLSKAKSGATITFTGTTTFGTAKWEGPLVLLGGSNLKVQGSGTLDGRGAWYWKQGQSITRPVFFRLQNVISSTVSGFTLKNSPFRTFSISSTNTIFSNNLCCGGHGVSIGSLGGNAVDQGSTVQGLQVSGNTIQNSDNGIRIKTIIGLKGLVSDVKYTNNKLQNVKNAIVMHSDYSKAKGGYTGSATSQVQIKGVTVSGLTGSATNLYDIVANPKVVSDWSFSGIQVSASQTGKAVGQPSSVDV